MRKVMTLLLIAATGLVGSCALVLGSTIAEGDISTIGSKQFKASKEGDLEFVKNGKGPILRASDGKKFRLTVGEDGQVKTEAVQ